MILIQTAFPFSASLSLSLSVMKKMKKRKMSYESIYLSSTCSGLTFLGYSLREDVLRPEVPASPGIGWLVLTLTLPCSDFTVQRTFFTLLQTFRSPRLRTVNKSIFRWIKESFRTFYIHFIPLIDSDITPSDIYGVWEWTTTDVRL